MEKNKKPSYDELVKLVTSQAETIKTLTEKTEKLSLKIAMGNSRAFGKKREHIDKE